MSTTHHPRKALVLAVALLFLQHEIEAFQIPLAVQQASRQQSTKEQSNLQQSRRRSVSKFHDWSPTTRLGLTKQSSDNHIMPTSGNDDDDDSYTELLQRFMEDYAQDALIELQSLNQDSILQSSSSSSSGAMVATIPAPAISEMSTSSSKPQNIDNRDEGDLWRARGLLIGAAALYGTNFSLVKLLGDTMPVGISTSLRFGLAALATLPWLIDADLFQSKNAQAATWLGLEVGMWNAIGYVAQAVGLETTLASKSAFICSMAVVIVPLLEFMTGKQLQTRQWIGAMMALVGVAFLELGGAGGLSEAVSSLTIGDGLSMVQPLVFGIGFWKMEKAMHKYPEEAQRLTAAQLMSVFIASAAYGVWSMSDAAMAAGTSFSLSTVANAYPWMEWLTSPSILFSLFWTGCITTALTIYMETMALETLSATETTLIFSTEPLWGTAFAAVVMGEQLGMNAAVGAFFILMACVYSNLGLNGLENSMKSSTAWLKQTMSGKRADGNPQTPFWRSLQEKWAWGASSLATTLATWNIATTNLNPQELNEIVDDLLDKFS